MGVLEEELSPEEIQYYQDAASASLEFVGELRQADFVEPLNQELLETLQNGIDESVEVPSSADLLIELGFETQVIGELADISSTVSDEDLQGFLQDTSFDVAVEVAAQSVLTNLDTSASFISGLESKRSYTTHTPEGIVAGIFGAILVVAAIVSAINNVKTTVEGVQEGDGGKIFIGVMGLIAGAAGGGIGAFSAARTIKRLFFP